MKSFLSTLLFLFFQIAVCLHTISISYGQAKLKEDENPKQEIRMGGGVAKDMRVFQLLEFKELEKIDWKPGKEDVPLSAGKAISLAAEFCKKNLSGKIDPELRNIILLSVHVNGVRRWFWQVNFPAITNPDEIRPGSNVSIAVSLSGKVMAGIERIEK